MSLKEDLMNSPKLDARLRASLAFLDDATDPAAPLFSLFVKVSGTGALDTKQVHVNIIAGDIGTAHNVSLNGLKELVDNPRVNYLQGSTKMRPNNGPRF
ncbi:MAG: hypothetical protein ACAH80_06220 [Alphaproteobacteria bacterium]